MARPSAEVILEQAVGDSRWQVLAADSYYVITYKDRPCNLRVLSYSLQGEVSKYKKLTYTNLGNAAAQARLLNYRFKCQDFAVMQVDFEQLD